MILKTIFIKNKNITKLNIWRVNIFLFFFVSFRNNIKHAILWFLWFFSSRWACPSHIYMLQIWQLPLFWCPEEFWYFFENLSADWWYVEKVCGIDFYMTYFPFLKLLSKRYNCNRKHCLTLKYKHVNSRRPFPSFLFGWGTPLLQGVGTPMFISYNCWFYHWTAEWD